MNRCDLQGGRAHNADVFRDGRRHGKWCLDFLNKKRGKRHRFSLKKPNRFIPGSTPAGLSWSKGVSRFNKDGKPLGFHPISRGPNKGKGISSWHGRGNSWSPGKCSSSRCGSRRQMRWSHVSANPTLSTEDQNVWCRSRWQRKTPRQVVGMSSQHQSWRTVVNRERTRNPRPRAICSSPTGRRGNP